MYKSVLFTVIAVFTFLEGEHLSGKSITNEHIKNVGFTMGHIHTALKGFRPKEIYDGALPSGNSIALYNLLRLERITADPDLGTKATLLIQAFSDTIREIPSGYTQFLASLYFVLSPTTELVIVGDPKARDTKEMLALLEENFLPDVVVLLKHPADQTDRLAALAPYTTDHTLINGKATAYVCQGYSCKIPTTDPSLLFKLLSK